METSGNWKAIAGNDVRFGFIVSPPGAILGQTFIFYSSMQTPDSEYEKRILLNEKKKFHQYFASSIDLQLI